MDIHVNRQVPRRSAERDWMDDDARVPIQVTLESKERVGKRFEGMQSLWLEQAEGCYGELPNIRSNIDHAFGEHTLAAQTVEHTVRSH